MPRSLATNDITAFYSSDERLKDNISKIEDPLAKVVSLGGYTFDWNEKTDNDGTETGVIAQEVESLGLPGMSQLEMMDIRQFVMKNLFHF